MVSKEELRNGFLATGIKKGDVLMVHSNYGSLRGVDGGPDEVIDTLIDLVGEEGTLLIPTFNFTAWSNEHYFDCIETASEMGVITEYARARTSFKRTVHPIYSFVVYGKKQEDFLACIDKEAFGPNSVFALFHQCKGLILSIGLGYNDSYTMVHYAEKIMNVDYRRIKEFSGIYIGYDRVPKLSTYTMFVRATQKIKTDGTKGLSLMEEIGIIKNIKIGNANVGYARAEDFHNSMLSILKDHPEYFHKK